MTFAQGNLYEEKAALLNIIKRTAEWRAKHIIMRREHGWIHLPKIHENSVENQCT